VGKRLGDVVGRFEGFAVGSGVDLPGRYVGSNVGDDVGASEGEDEGFIVGAPGKYVGFCVGFLLAPA